MSWITSHAYMGREQFAHLQAMLPSDVDVLGIDAHTPVVLNFAVGAARVFGSGGLTWLHGGRVLRFDAGASVPLQTFGLRQQPAGSEDIPADVWDSSAASRRADRCACSRATASVDPRTCFRARQGSRARRWARADESSRACVSRLGGPRHRRMVQS